jgi:transcriptional regulator with XRE-family HTH domain
MKASHLKLGSTLQHFLSQHGVSLEQLAVDIGMNPDSLSNIIHGRRRFRDITLEKLADTTLFKANQFSLRRLKALRALDDYSFDEIITALTEGVRLGLHEGVDDPLFASIQRELGLSGEAQIHPLTHSQQPPLKASC